MCDHTSTHNMFSHFTNKDPPHDWAPTREKQVSNRRYLLDFPQAEKWGKSQHQVLVEQFRLRQHQTVALETK